MIAFDTNVLLRCLLDDDDRQSPKARRLFNRADRILLTDIVLAETIWTLKGKRYGASRDELLAIIDGLLDDSKIVFESDEAVRAARNEYADAQAPSNVVRMNSIDFVDALIVCKAKYVAAKVGEAYAGTYTFDRGALSIDGMLPA